MKGYLGEIPGMTFDPVKGKYFKTSLLPSAGCGGRGIPFAPGRASSQRNTGYPGTDNRDRWEGSSTDFHSKDTNGRNGNKRRRRDAGDVVLHPNASQRRNAHRVQDDTPQSSNDGKSGRGSRGDWAPTRGVCSRQDDSPDADMDIVQPTLATRSRATIRQSAFKLPSRHPLLPSLTVRATGASSNRSARMWTNLQPRHGTSHQELLDPLTQVVSVPGHKNALIIGDDVGAITAVMHEYDPRNLPTGEPVEVEEIENHSSRRIRTKRHDWEDSRWLWRDLNLGNKITGLKCSQDRYTALSFGPHPKLVLAPFPAMIDGFSVTSTEFIDRPTIMYELHKIKDAWALDRFGTSVVVGGNQLIYSTELENARFQGHKTGSDVLSLKQLSENEALAGLRNGQIRHFDFRVPPGKSGNLRAQLGKAVVGLESLDEGSVGGGRSLVASGLQHELLSLDLRFPTAAPVHKFEGHFNDYRMDLGLAIDPSQSFLWAAGSDHSVRLWDLRTGERLSSTLGLQPAFAESQEEWREPLSPLDRLFEDPVTGLEVPETGVLNILNGRQLEIFSANRDLLTYAGENC